MELPGNLSLFLFLPPLLVKALFCFIPVALEAFHIVQLHYM